MENFIHTSLARLSEKKKMKKKDRVINNVIHLLNLSC